MNRETKHSKQSTRDIILQTIGSASGAGVSIEELARAASISPVTVRHHISGLQAEGLIEATSVRRKVGRPYYIYSLSEKGQERFPKRYVRLTSRLLDELKDRLPPDIVTDVFRSVVQGIMENHRGEFEHLPLEARLNYLVALLEEEGFLASWEKTEEGYRLTEYGCPFISIGRTHDEICTFDTELMLNVLQLPVQQESCMLKGDECCQFTLADA